MRLLSSVITSEALEPLDANIGTQAEPSHGERRIDCRGIQRVITMAVDDMAMREALSMALPL